MVTWDIPPALRLDELHVRVYVGGGSLEAEKPRFAGEEEASQGVGGCLKKSVKFGEVGYMRSA